MQLGKRLASLVISDIRSMSRACDAVGGINLGQGICDLPTPPAVADAAREAITTNQVVYTAADGIQPLRAAVGAKIERQYGLRYDPASEIVITSGATGGFAAACLSLFDPGDEIILFEPYYGYHLNTVISFGLTPVLVATRPPDWTVDFEALARAVTPRTRAVLVCSPSNPCGKVWTEAELDKLADLLEEHDLIAITDEIYEHIVYEGEHSRMADIPGMADLTITISGLSKTYSATGWRIGWVIAPPAATNAVRKVHDFLTVGAAAPLQEGAATALAFPDEYYVKLASLYREKRDFLTAVLRDVGFRVFEPHGAYYIMTDISGLGWSDDVAFARWLINEIGVAVVPGSSFYRDPRDGSTQVRFCFCKRPETLQLARELLTGVRASGGQPAAARLTGSTETGSDRTL